MKVTKSTFNRLFSIFIMVMAVIFGVNGQVLMAETALPDGGTSESGHPAEAGGAPAAGEAGNGGAARQNEGIATETNGREHFNEKGTEGLDVAESEHLEFTADEWRAMSDVEKQKTLMNYRIAYLGETMVNWCAGLGTVLANDEVVNGVSERGGFPVVQKKMQQ